MHANTTEPHTCYARFSAGKGTIAHDASVSLGLSGIEIACMPPGPNLIWSYQTLRTEEPIRSHAIDVLLTSETAPGASLFIPDPTCARALREFAPHLTAHAERWRNARPWLIGTLAIAAVFALVYAIGWSPLRTIAASLPLTWRERLGDQAVASMVEEHRKCVAPEGMTALAALTERLGKSAVTDETFKVEVYDWPLVNAFAVPGGRVVITRGLIEEAQSPDEVAGVLAHEMGHGIELHPETGIIRAIGLTAAVEVMLGGTGGGLANLGIILAQLGYTRAAEHAADLQALRLLKEAAISPQGLGDFFRRVQKNEGQDSDGESFKPFDLLRTHPPLAARELLVRNQADYPATPALDATSWDELKRICQKTQPREASP